MKYTKANTLREQEAIARWGKGARHPICLAALHLWWLQAELSKLENDIPLFREEVVSSAKWQKEHAQALIEQFRKERKEEEANEASANLRKIDDLLLKAQASYDAQVKLFLILSEFWDVAAEQFERELDAIERTKDVKAFRAYQRLKKRWQNASANGAHLTDGDRRTLRILKLVRAKVIKAVAAKDGAAAGYWEAATGGDRLLSDEVFQGRLTAQEIRSHIKATDGARVAGDKYAKEVRRCARKQLGIRPKINGGESINRHTF